MKDYYGAVADYNKAIEINPNFADHYFNRGNEKGYLKDYYGAIADYTKAIELDPNYSIAYFTRGASKEKLADMSGACSDYKIAASFGNTNLSRWEGFRGMLNRSLIRGNCN